MNYLSIDYLILYAFLVVILVVGYRAGRGVKDMRDFAVGNRKGYGVSMILLTFLATNTAAFVEVSEVFNSGIIITIALFGLVVDFVFAAIWIAPNIQYFKNCISMADVMGNLYGTKSRVITGILGILDSICMIALGLVAFSSVCESLLKIDATYGIIVCGILVSFYTAHGGIKSVTVTDCIQVMTLFVAILILTYLSVNKSGGLATLLSITPPEKLKIIDNANFPLYLTLFLMWSVFPVGFTCSAIFQRLLMAKNGNVIRNQYLSLLFIDPFMHIIFMLIGLAGIILYPTLQPNLVLSHMANDIVPIGLKGIVLAGMVSMVMGFVDSYLHISGVLFVNDVLKPLCNKNKKIDELRYTKITIILIGILGIWAALQANRAIELTVTAMQFTGPVLMFPLIAGIMGLKPDTKVFFWATSFTIVAFVLSNFFLTADYAHLGIIISIITNMISFLICHYIQNQGFAIVKRDKSKCEQKSMEFEIFNPFHLTAYAKTKAEQFGTSYIAFGVFFLVSFGIILFFWDIISNEYLTPILWLKFIGGTLCVLLIAEEKWFDNLRKYLPLFWYITLGFALPFTGMLMLLITNGDIQWLIQLGMGISILFVFIDMTGFFSIFTPSILAALLVYVYWLKGSIHINLHIDSPYSVIWQTAFGICAFGYFLNNRQKEWGKFAVQQAVMGASQRRNFLESTQESHRLAKTLQTAGVGYLCGVALQVKDTLDEASKVLDKSSPLLAKLNKINSELTPIAVETYDVEQRAVEHLQLTVSNIAIAEMINTIMYDLDSLQLKKDVSFYNKSKKQSINCDFSKIQTVFTNAILFARSFVKDEEINIVVDDAKLIYGLNSTDNGRTMNLDAIRITITTQEYSQIDTNLVTYKSEMYPAQIEIPEKETDLPLLQNKRIIRAHYGFSSSEVKQDECTQVYVIPCELRKVRPKEMDNV